MLRIRLLASLMGLLFTVVLSAQTSFAPISGVAIDAETKEPLIGVSIVGQGRSTGTVSDFDGKWTFAVSDQGEPISFSYIGYKTQDVFLVGAAGAEEVVIALQPGSDLGEIVVTALGLKRDNRELGYAVQQIQGEALTDVQAVNFLDNLSGQVAGLRVTAGATGVGSTSQIIIRGQT